MACVDNRDKSFPLRVESKNKDECLASSTGLSITVGGVNIIVNDFKLNDLSPNEPITATIIVPVVFG